MRVVVQRVSRAQVLAELEVVGKIGRVVLVLLGVGATDVESDAEYLASKIAGLRIFEDSEGKINRDVTEVRGEALVVSQFTLFGDVRRGNRPSFAEAAPPGHALRLYEYFVKCLRDAQVPVQTGRFQATMHVDFVNDGPVTILIDSKKQF